MRRPTGILAHHNFIQLSQRCGWHNVYVDYRKDGPFTLPEAIQPYKEELMAYWLKESSGLKDFESIVSVSRAAAWQRGGIGVDAGQISILLQPTTYFSFLFSNYSLDVPLSNGETLRKMYDRGEFGMFQEEPAHARGGGCSQFCFPKFGNSLGITISVVTADSQLIIAKRSESSDIARDKGNWLCAVGTQVKRHQDRFLNPSTKQPCPLTSAQQGLHDEMGMEIRDSCAPLLCLGLVYRDDFHHCEILYEAVSRLRADALINLWQKTEVPDKREIERIEAIDLSESPEALVAHLGDQSNRWSPQHAAGAFHSAARRFPEELRGFGLQL